VTLGDRPLFVFGTLMDRDVLVSVTGMPLSELEIHAGMVNGFKRRMVRGETFPVLVPDAKESVSGLLIYGLSDIAVQRAKFFEGDEYTLKAVRAVGLPDSHTTLKAGAVDTAYFADNQVYEIEPRDWSIEHWQALDKTEFLYRLANYMQHFGSLSATEADKHW